MKLSDCKTDYDLYIWAHQSRRDMFILMVIRPIIGGYMPFYRGVIDPLARSRILQKFFNKVGISEVW